MTEDPRKTGKRLHRLLREALTIAKGLAAADTVRDAGAAYETQHSGKFHIERYSNTRFWGLYEGDELLAVTVYRKGAEAVRDRLQAQEAKIAQLSQDQPDSENTDRPGAVERITAARGKSGEWRR